MSIQNRSIPAKDKLLEFQKFQVHMRIMDMKQIASMLTSTTQMMTALLSAVAAVSLLVGAIGIMNMSSLING